MSCPLDYGSLRPLYRALKNSIPFLSSALARPVSILFGEENIIAQDQELPYVCMVPTGGNYTQPGYNQGGSGERITWNTTENVDLYLWSDAAVLSDTVDTIDHADAVEELRMRVLQALQQQTAQGLMFRPISGRWEMARNAVNRDGRCYILSVTVDITIPDVAPTFANVNKVTIDPIVITESVDGAVLSPKQLAEAI